MTYEQNLWTLAWVAFCLAASQQHWDNDHFQKWLLQGGKL